MEMPETRRWRFKGPEMEGPIARWYARIRGSASQLEAYHKQALDLTAGLRDGVQELHAAAQRAGRDAPGPSRRRFGGDPGHESGGNPRRHRPGGQGNGPRPIQRVHDDGDPRDAQAPRLRAVAIRTPGDGQ